VTLSDWLPYALNVPLEILSIFGAAAIIAFVIIPWVGRRWP
jgi:hypothetical protein